MTNNTKDSGVELRECQICSAKPKLTAEELTDHKYKWNGTTQIMHLDCECGLTVSFEFNDSKPEHRVNFDEWNMDLLYRVWNGHPKNPQTHIEGVEAKHAGCNIDASPLCEKGYAFLQGIIDKLPTPKTPRFRLEDYNDSKDNAGQTLWDGNNPIAGFFVFRNHMNNSKLITWNTRATPTDNEARLRDLVIVLEDGAEPEAGDVIGSRLGFWTLGELDFGGKVVNSGFKSHEHWWRTLWDGKIIQRQGKPVIYQSALKEQPTGE